jgi:hypothetical protein
MPELKGPSVGIESLVGLGSTARKRKLLQALLAASMKDSPTVINTPGGHSQANWSDPVGNAMMAVMARRGNDKLDEQERTQALAIEDQTQRDLTGMFDPLRTDQNPVKMDDEGNAAPPAMGLSPDLQQVEAAARSTNPDVRKTGLEMMKDYARQMAEAKAKGKQGTWNFSDDVATHANVDEQGRPRIQSQPIQTWSPPTKATPDMPAITTSSLTQKPTAIGSGQLSQDPGIVFGKEESQAAMKRVAEGAEEANLGVRGLSLVADVKDKLSKIPPEQFGRGAGARMWLNQWAQSVGFKVSPDTAKLEDVHAALGQILIENARAFAPVTKVDLDELKEILGSTRNTQQALATIMDRLERKSQMAIDRHENFIDNMQKDPRSLDKWRTGKRSKPTGEPSIESLLAKYK